MVNLKEFEKNFHLYSEKLKKRGVSEELLLSLKEHFLVFKREKQILEKLQAKQNELSKLFGIFLREKKDISSLKTEVEENKAKISAQNEIVKKAQEKLHSISLYIPNIQDDDVPYGEDESDNIEIEKVLPLPVFDFVPKNHWELAQKLDWIDFERGVKLSKSRFSLFKGVGAKLIRALINYMLDFNAERGFEEISPPLLVNSRTMTATGQLPKFKEDLFKVCEEDLFLIPTAEVPLTNIYQNEIIKDLSNPIKLTAYTPCFRKEAGAGGKDIRGIIRQHQFDKVELVAIAKPQDSDKVFKEMVKCASDLLTSLNLPHRLVKLCTKDLGFSAAKTIDIEVWLPAQQKYREISSISNTRDFQARRGLIRYKEDKKNRFVHTLNGSSLAVGRTLVAIMENFQTKNGDVIIPTVLHKYL
jgi:seryl-tRNA synthetase